MIDLAVVMPAYNEEGCIADVVRGWLDLLKGKRLTSYKLIVVNDGSRDRTGAILDQLAAAEPALAVVHQQNGGHGRALVRGYEEAIALGARWVFQTDSDDQFDINDFDLLWAKRAESLFIIGRRKVRYDAFHRLVITRILRFLNFLLFGRFLWDTNIPFRLIDARYLGILLKQIPPRAFAPNIFLCVLAARDGQRLFEIPITHRDRRTGQVSIVRWGLIKACLRSARELFEFRVGLGASLAAVGAARKQGAAREVG